MFMWGEGFHTLPLVHKLGIFLSNYFLLNYLLSIIFSSVLKLTTTFTTYLLLVGSFIFVFFSIAFYISCFNFLLVVFQFFSPLFIIPSFYFLAFLIYSFSFSFISNLLHSFLSVAPVKGFTPFRAISFNGLWPKYLTAFKADCHWLNDYRITILYNLFCFNVIETRLLIFGLIGSILSKKLYSV